MDAPTISSDISVNVKYSTVTAEHYSTCFKFTVQLHLNNEQLNRFSPNKMACIFCLRETNHGISIFGDSEVAENARNTIVKYFWFDVSHSDSPLNVTISFVFIWLQKNDINSIENYACSDCWSKVETFHEFYQTVEAIHKRNTDIDIDEKTTFNLLLLPGCKIESETDLVVKHEINTLECFTPEYETNYFQCESNSEEPDQPDVESDHNLEKTGSKPVLRSERLRNRLISIEETPTFTSPNKRKEKRKNIKTQPESINSTSKKRTKSSKLKHITSISKPSEQDGRSKKKRIVEKIM